MDPRVMWFIAALVTTLTTAAPVSDSLVLLVKTPVYVQRDHTTTLPCWLNPPQSAEGLDIRWYRPDHFDSPVMRYREKKFDESSQEASYAGRVSFGSREASSGGLTAGDVSLKLVNATFKDAGVYTCYVSSDKGYDSAEVNLIVTAKGSSPLLSEVWTDKDNLVNVSCESEGWFPVPSLHWSDKNHQDLKPKSLTRSVAPSGLLSVHSWILVSSSTEVTCSVGLAGEEAKEARVRLEKSHKSTTESGSSAAGWVAFGLLLVATLAALGFLYYKKPWKKAEADQVDGVIDTSECQKLLASETTKPKDLADKHYVNVKLDEVENKYVRIKGNVLRDHADVPFPDGPRVTCLSAIKGTPGFTSGQHYWEVSLCKVENEVKQSWWVGVTSATAISSELTSPTASKGYLFLSSSPDEVDRLRLSTDPVVLLPVQSRPHTVGVYLNYDGGELSFYNVEKECLIGSLSAKFEGEVFPFFNPGKGDRSPMEILHRTEEDKPTDMGNSVEP